MLSYAWPGNVRALRHAVERAVILAEGDSISELDLQLSAADAVKVAQGAQATDVDADDLNLERMEKRTIQAALTRHRYNISHAARELGLTRAALYRRMEKHDL